jgi:hypothetical protein
MTEVLIAAGVAIALLAFLMVVSFWRRRRPDDFTGEVDREP